MNSLLKHQIRRFFGAAPEFDQSMVWFLNAVDEAYTHYEEDRRLLERSMDLTSTELMGLNDKLRESDEKHQAILNKLIGFVVALKGKEAPPLQTEDLIEVANHLEKQIRERQEFAEQIVKDRARLRALIESTEDEIWAVDKELKLTSFNTSFLDFSFLSKESVPEVGMPLQKVWEPSQWVVIEHLLKHALLGNRMREEIHYEKEGNAIFYEISFSPIQTDTEVIGVTIFCRNITELKKNEERLLQAKRSAEKANQLKTRFLTILSHELRTPLNAIIGYGELLGEEFGKEEANRMYREDVKKILLAGHHLLALVDEILDITKVESGQLRLEIKKIDVKALIDDIALMIETIITKRNNELKLHIPDSIGEIETDELRLRQILSNLLSTVSNFSSSEEIHLSVYAEDGRIFFSVKSGIIVEEDKIKKIFALFTQGNETSTQEVGDIEIGLALTHKYCNVLGGEMHIESQPGKGSHFIFWLPRTFRPTQESIGFEKGLGEWGVF